jgi:hypothetical protein
MKLRFGAIATGAMWIAFAAALAFNTRWLPANPWIWKCDATHCWAWRNVVWLVDDSARAVACLTLLALAFWAVRR